MPLPAYDRPPIDPTAIVAYFDAARLRHDRGEIGETATPSKVAVRYEPRQHRTNAARQQLSIARARLSSLCMAAREELDRYATFTAGWDGYDAEPIAPVALKFAHITILALPALGDAARLTDIIPGPAPDGSLDLELRTASQRLTITIYAGRSPDELEIRTLRSQGDLSGQERSIGPDALVADLRWILA